NSSWGPPLCIARSCFVDSEVYSCSMTMKKLLTAALLTLLFVHLSSGSGIQNRSLDAVLPGLSPHIRQNLDGLPGLVCEERMSWAGHVAVSDYKPIRNDSPLGYQVIETRDVKSIDGQAVGKDGNKQGLPRFNGVATSLTVALLPDNYLFSIHGTEVID